MTWKPSLGVEPDDAGDEDLIADPDGRHLLGISRAPDPLRRAGPA